LTTRCNFSVINQRDRRENLPAGSDLPRALLIPRTASRPERTAGADKASKSPAGPLRVHTGLHRKRRKDLLLAGEICKIFQTQISLLENPILLRAGLILILLASCGHSQEFLQVKSRSGDGLYSLLRRYKLPTDLAAVAKFKDLNKGRLQKNGQLVGGRSYKLPVLVLPYDGLSITSSLNLQDKSTVDRIDQYNFQLYQAGLRKQPYTRNQQLWVPLHLWSPGSTALEEMSAPLSSAAPAPLPDKYPAAKQLRTSFKNTIFYLDAGHGGPDPGAIGRRGKDFLYEDEYAYDITLRLGQRLQEFGATVVMIVQDPNDGIREEAILGYDTDEYYCDRTTISHDLAQRLGDRAAIVNRLHRQNKSRFQQQIALIIHVDSRSHSQRVDIFYYYQDGVKASRDLARTLMETIENKYHAAQPGRGYDSSISTRNLHMLSALNPTAVYIELGNIRNPKDQDRFIKPDNRQAVANWLCDGLLAAVRRK